MEVDDGRRRLALSPKALRALSFCGIVVGAVAGTAAIMWAAFYWTHDELITPHGWIIVGGTTACALGCFLGPFGLARARDRELQVDAAAAIEQLRATAALFQPMIEPMMAHSDLTVDLGELAKQVELNARLLIKAEDERAPIVRAALQTMSQMRRINERLDAMERSITTIEGSHRVFDRVIEVVARHGVPRQAKSGEAAPFDRDTAWLADMAEAMELGRKLGERGDPPPAEV